MVVQITVQGVVDATWSEWFSGMDIRTDSGDGEVALTTLTGPVVDQACLRGILNRLWDLNLAIVSVTRLDPDANSR